MILTITPGAELPDRTITWQESDGTPIDFSASPHTFRLVFDFPSPVTKETGISGAANGLVTISFTAAETDSYPPGKHYTATLWAKRSVDNKDREPVRMLAHIYG